MISINATLIVQVVNLLILIWILNKILFKPILRIMEEREQKITESNAEMERLRVDAAEKAQAIEAQMKQARREASAKKDEVCSRASVEAQRIIDAGPGQGRRTHRFGHGRSSKAGRRDQGQPG